MIFTKTTPHCYTIVNNTVKDYLTKECFGTLSKLTHLIKNGEVKITVDKEKYFIYINEVLMADRCWTLTEAIHIAYKNYEGRRCKV